MSPSRSRKRRADPAGRTATAALRALRRVFRAYGPGLASRKLVLLARLERAALPRPRQVLDLHEALAFLAAHPDDRRLLALVRRMLRGFSQRRDLRRHMAALENSGIAGTATAFRFFASMAVWLAARWPERLAIDWAALEDNALLETLLPFLAHPAEQPGLDEYDLGARGWIDLLRRPPETDATFLTRRLAALAIPAELREAIVDALDLPYRLTPGPGGPSRTPERIEARRIHFQREPLRRERPDLAAESRRPPTRVRAVTPREGSRLVDLAREAMAARSRDLDAFANADPRDVRLVEFERGLAFAALGVVPERRLLLESVYGFLTLRNGVPTGYVLTGALYGSCEIAYNVFETFRDGESAWVYARAIAMACHLFGADAFTIPPYQLGEGNDEAIESGAWWFYHKLGFRPRGRATLALAARELARMRRRPGHRSSPATLRRLAREPLFLHLGSERPDVMGRIPLPNVGLAAARMIAARFGSDRERGAVELADEAIRALGLRSLRGFTRGERMAWRNWAPLVPLLLAHGRWSTADRRALVEVIRAKGGRRESDFVRRFDAHAALRRALQRIAEGNAPPG